MRVNREIITLEHRKVLSKKAKDRKKARLTMSNTTTPPTTSNHLKQSAPNKSFKTASLGDPGTLDRRGNKTFVGDKVKLLLMPTKHSIKYDRVTKINKDRDKVILRTDQ